MKHRQKIVIATAIVAAFMVFALSGTAGAVAPRQFVEESPEHYTQGAGENIVWNQRGVMQLGREMKALLRDNQPERLDYVTALTRGPDGAIYAVGGNRGNVIRIAGNEIRVVARLQDPVLFSIAAAKDGTLYVGSGGTNARIWKIDADGAVSQFFRDADIAYYWALAVTPKGRLLAATGAGGKLLNIGPDGKANILLESEQKHLRALYLARSGDVFVGTDGQAVLYRIDTNGRPFIIHHGSQAEITSITADADEGSIYFAAATPAASGEQIEGFPSIQSLSLSRYIAPEKKNGEGGDNGENGAKPGDGNNGDDDDAGADGASAADDGSGRSSDEPAANGRIIQGASGRTSGERNSPAVTKQAVEPALRGEAFSSGDASANDHGERVEEKSAGGAGDDEGNNDQAPSGSTTTPQPAQNNGEAGSFMMVSDGDGGASSLAARQAAQSAAPPQGNGVYRVTADGMVRRIYATGEGMLLALLVDEGQLLVGSTVGGQIIAVNLDDETVAAVARAECSQVTALARAGDGSVVIGAADPGALYRLESGLSDRGRYISKVYDAGMSARFGQLKAILELPQGSSVSFSTRSGNIPEADDQTWSAWSDEIRAGDQIASPPARYLQLRVSFTASEASESPLMRRLTVAYMQGNQPPKIEKFEQQPQQQQSQEGAAAADLPPARTVIALAWQAADPNEDALRYSLFQKKIGDEQWILIADRVAEAAYPWNIAGLPDGQYELLLLADDATANAPGEEMMATRNLGPILIDNTKPAISDFSVVQEADALRIKAVATDQAGDIVSLRYSVDGKRNWRPLMPVDGIADGPREELDVLVPLPQPGGRVITLQIFDQAGNVAAANATLNVVAAE